MVMSLPKTPSTFLTSVPAPEGKTLKVSASKEETGKVPHRSRTPTGIVALGGTHGPGSPESQIPGCRHYFSFYTTLVSVKSKAIPFIVLLSQRPASPLHLKTFFQRMLSSILL